MHEECGVFGVFNNGDASRLTYLGLYALQHRGQESAGIASSDGSRIVFHRGMGLVSQVFNRPAIFDDLPGKSAIGHNRYSTAGSSTNTNAQPLVIDFKAGQLAAAHNGNLVNARSLRAEMEEDGSIFTTTTDSEVILHLVARSKHHTMDTMILDALSRVKGAYSVLFMTKEALYGARDPRGVRPLILGKAGESYFLSSETCAFDLIGATMVREIEPGEMVRITADGVTSYRIPVFGNIGGPAHCVFEFIYFSRPDSYVFGTNVDKVRRKLGRQLAREYPTPDADLVMGIPDSATTAALGYSEESGIRFDIGLIRNHYVGRTFIQPAQHGRDFGVRIKFNTVKGVLKGKKIVIVDDSVVRGTTMRKIVALLKTAEPGEIHLRISSPPVLCPCFYGIDMPTTDELIGASKATDEIRDYLGVNSLGYLSIDGMLSVVPGPRENFCAACFNGRYPMPVAEDERRAAALNAKS
ncbi:MAG: amidophosphoribosyltransferase [Chitinivibrionales bacterium]|nr:amidophosphoribosyltransferase [Chitinivibrionales bacterium]MBD3357360.1 amidophosphoribosyltransferase [Chitinivibrionales bacterium]